MGKVFQSLWTWFGESRRYVKGAGPTPGTIDCLVAHVAGRPSLDIENWTEQARLRSITPQVARFVFEFFAAREVPIGKVRLDDRLEADLLLTKVLPQEWGDEFQESFMDRFGVSRFFRPGPAPTTIGGLLAVVQKELDDWRADSTRE